MSEGRENWLKFIKEVKEECPDYDVCECWTVKRYVKDIVRNMHVCIHCNKPPAGNLNSNTFCFECGKRFTYQRQPDKVEKYPFCPTCE